jgi:hypothetical protein
MEKQAEAADPFTDSGSSPPEGVTQDKLIVPTADDLFPVEEKEDDELSYFGDLSGHLGDEGSLRD